MRHRYYLINNAHEISGLERDIQELFDTGRVDTYRLPKRKIKRYRSNPTNDFHKMGGLERAIQEVFDTKQVDTMQKVDPRQLILKERIKQRKSNC
jgi:hypothetical protein